MTIFFVAGWLAMMAVIHFRRADVFIYTVPDEDGVIMHFSLSSLPELQGLG